MLAPQRTKKSLSRTPKRLRATGGGGHDPHHHRPSGHGPKLRPGDPVRESGIYEVVHGREHRAAHEVVMLKGTTFPSCDTCNENVRFRLIRTAPYIFQDGDFEEQ